MIIHYSVYLYNDPSSFDDLDTTLARQIEKYVNTWGVKPDAYVVGDKLREHFVKLSGEAGIENPLDALGEVLDYGDEEAKVLPMELALGRISNEQKFRRSSGSAITPV